MRYKIIGRNEKGICAITRIDAENREEAEAFAETLIKWPGVKITIKEV